MTTTDCDECAFGGEPLPCTCVRCPHEILPRYCVACLSIAISEIRAQLRAATERAERAERERDDYRDECNEFREASGLLVDGDPGGIEPSHVRRLAVAFGDMTVALGLDLEAYFDVAAIARSLRERAERAEATAAIQEEARVIMDARVAHMERQRDTADVRERRARELLERMLDVYGDGYPYEETFRAIRAYLESTS